jgi:hypothetical protein
MANEAVIIELGATGGNPVLRTCSDSTGIEKGALLTLSDPNTVVTSTNTTGSVFGGIAAQEKVASDGSTTISVYTDGVFDLTNNAGGTPSVGAIVVLSGVNLIRAAVAGDLLTGAVIGKLEETASASEVVRVRLTGK